MLRVNFENDPDDGYCWTITKGIDQKRRRRRPTLTYNNIIIVIYIFICTFSLATIRPPTADEFTRPRDSCVQAIRRDRGFPLVYFYLLTHFWFSETIQ